MDTRFDGDQLNFSLAIDNYIAEQYRHLAPHKSVFGLSEPYKVEDTITIPKPVIGTISSWMSLKEPPDAIKMDKMKQLFC